MIGVIVTGHGNFAEGMVSAAELIAGRQENVVAVNFPNGDTSENLQRKLKQAVQMMNCTSVLFLTDIVGGTPFNQSVMVSSETEKETRVISGTNMPVLIEAIFSRVSDNIEALATSLVASEQAKAQLYGEVKRIKNKQSEGGI